MTNTMKEKLIRSWSTNNENHVENFSDKNYFNETLSIEGSDENWVIHLKINNKVIEDMKYSGSGSMLAESVISYLSRKLVKKNVDTILEQLKNFEDFILSRKVRSLSLYELVVYEDIRRQPENINRVLYGPKVIMNIIENL